MHNLEQVETGGHAGDVWAGTRVASNSRKVLPLETDQLDKSGLAHEEGDFDGLEKHG